METLVQVYKKTLPGLVEAILNSPVLGPSPRTAELDETGNNVVYKSQGKEVVATAISRDPNIKPGTRVIISFI